MALNPKNGSLKLGETMKTIPILEFVILHGRKENGSIQTVMVDAGLLVNNHNPADYFTDAVVDIDEKCRFRADVISGNDAYIPDSMEIRRG